MSVVVAFVIVLSSIALSVALSRLAVGEFFRLARIDSRRAADSSVAAK